MNNLICRDGAECDIKLKQENDETEDVTSTGAAFVHGAEGLIQEEKIFSNIKIEETQLMLKSIDNYENANTMEASTIGDQTVVTEPDDEFDKDITDDVREFVSDEVNNSSVGSCNKINQNSKPATTPFPFVCICETCDMQFYSRRDLRQHIKIHGKNLYQCKTCNKWFPQRCRLTEHMQMHSEKPLHKCPYCESSVYLIASLVRHIKRKHGKTYKVQHQSDINKPETNKWYSVEFTCDVCGNIFNDQRYFDLHMKIHASKNEVENSTNKGPLNCTYCGKIFKKRVILREHLRVHTKERPFKCKICNKTFNTQGSVYRHLQIHEKNSRYHCKVCNEGFLTRWELSNHVKTHSGHQYHKDDNKAKLVKDEEKEVEQIRKDVNTFDDDDDDDVEEEFINIEQKGMDALKDFVLQTNGNEIQQNYVQIIKQDNDETEDATSTVQTFIDDCEEFIEEDQILSNIKIEDTQLMPESIDTYKYEIANTLKPTTIGEQINEVTTVVTERDEEFDTDVTDDVREFLSDEDNNSSGRSCNNSNQNSKTTANSAPFSHICETCDLHFTNRKDLQQHRNMHSEKRYQCTTCSKCFTKRYRLKNHKQTHVQKPPHEYKCTHCERLYHTKDSMTRHLRIHHGSQYETFYDIDIPETSMFYSVEFTCDVCGEIFNAQRYLDFHMNIHLPNNEAENSTSKGPLNCAYCGKIFKTSWLLKQHLRVHTKERPFKCKLCDHTFKYSGSVMRHVRQQHAENRKFHCKVCNRSFYRKGSLLKHVRTHSLI